MNIITCVEKQFLLTGRWRLSIPFGERPIRPWKRVKILQHLQFLNWKGFFSKAKRIFIRGKQTARVYIRAGIRAAGKASARLRSAGKRQRSQMIRRAAVLAVMVGVTAASVATVMAATRWASVVVDGKEKTSVEITSDATSDILARAGVSAGQDDLVQRQDLKTGDIAITVKTGRRVSVAADGKKNSVLLHYGDKVADALKKAGVTLNAEDKISKQVSVSVQDGDEIEVTRMYRVSIAADGSSKDVLVHEGTVTQALSQAGVSLGQQDLVSRALGSSVAEGMQIAVSRVSCQEKTVSEAIPFKTVTKKDSSLASGKKKVETAGRAGVKSVVERQKFQDGKVVETTAIRSTVVTKPVDQVVLVGTKRSSSGSKSGSAKVFSDGTLIDQSGQTVHYKKLLQGRCSCYCTGTMTSTGVPPAYGRVAVNPHVIPYGTRLYICSPDGKLVYGYATAADTGGAAMHGVIIADLYYSSYQQCTRIGTRTMNVYVLG